MRPWCIDTGEDKNRSSQILGRIDRTYEDVVLDVVPYEVWKKMNTNGIAHAKR